MRKNDRYFKVFSEDCIKLIGKASASAVKLYFLLLSHIEVDHRSTPKRLVVKQSQRTLAKEFYNLTKKTNTGSHNSAISRYAKELTEIKAIHYIPGKLSQISTYIIGFIDDNKDVLFIESLSDDKVSSSDDSMSSHEQDENKVITGCHLSDDAVSSGDDRVSSHIPGVMTGCHRGDDTDANIYIPNIPIKNNPNNTDIPQKSLQENKKTGSKDPLEAFICELEQERYGVIS